MAKSKKFRVAVAGGTIDGRKIERSWLEQISKNYNQQTYGARVWVEHLRGILPDSSFRAYGDVIAVTTEEVEINGEKQLALYAEIDATDDLIEMNKKRQKIYTSIEVDPDFQGKGEAYLVGLAITDSPASIGTEKLSFSSMVAKFGENSEKNAFSVAEESKIEFEDDGKGMFTGLIQKFSEMFTPKLEAQEKDVQTNFLELKTVLEKAGDAFTAQETAMNTLQQKFNQLESKYSELETKYAEIDKKFNEQPDPNHETRPPQTGNQGSSVAVVY